MALPVKLESSSFSLVPSDSKHVIRVTLNRIPENPLFPDSLCTLMVCQKKFHQKRLQIPGLTAILQHRKIGPHNPGLLDHLNFTSLDQFIDLPQLRAHLGTLSSSLKPEIPTLYEDLAPQISALATRSAAMPFCISAEIDIFFTDYVGQNGDLDSSSTDLDALFERIASTAEGSTVLDKFMASSFVAGKDSDKCTICMEEEFDGTSNLIRTPCAHAFHKSCVVRWLIMNKNTCPLCRSQLLDCLHPTTISLY
ncbi:putative transcription factor C2H2 family [Rosa chinensis]|uniref:Putative transcription factor C2H2 family n=1 Tax=Rosa chinensis TaxID=74649 RepID=A0A2P6PDH1_ROSCH|nr:putative transcription factor C2H2 family [Rosa chinensis]